MKVICISGKAGSGKDTVAEILQQELINFYGDGVVHVLIIHYADLLKHILKSYFNWDGKKDERGREMLQKIGTNVVRKADENFWVDFVAKFLKIFDPIWDIAVIPDARFTNEIAVLSAEGFNVFAIRVSRNENPSQLTSEQKTHESETSLDNYKFDAQIDNDGTIEELREKVKQVVHDWHLSLQKERG